MITEQPESERGAGGQSLVPWGHPGPPSRGRDSLLGNDGKSSTRSELAIPIVYQNTSQKAAKWPRMRWELAGGGKRPERAERRHRVRPAKLRLSPISSISKHHTHNVGIYPQITRMRQGTRMPPRSLEVPQPRVCSWSRTVPSSCGAAWAGGCLLAPVHKHGSSVVFVLIINVPLSLPLPKPCPLRGAAAPGADDRAVCGSEVPFFALPLLSAGTAGSRG